MDNKVKATITEITPLRAKAGEGAAIHYTYTGEDGEHKSVYKCFPIGPESSAGYSIVVCGCLSLFGAENINEIQNTPEEINAALESLGKSGDKFKGMEVVAVLGGKFGTRRLEEAPQKNRL